MDLQEKIHNNTLELFNSFKTLNQVEVEFKPSEKVWSILECVEHVYLIAEIVLKVFVTPPVTEKTEDSPTELFGEQKLNKLLITNRAFKAPAPDFVSPKGRFANSADAMENINRIIGEIIQHINANTIEKETQTIKHPVLGEMTKVDWVHFMISHTNRHILQIEDLKTLPDFFAINLPKER